MAHPEATAVECIWQQRFSGKGQQATLSQADAPISGRVLHVVNGEHYAGAERVQDLLGRALPWFGYEAGIASVKPGQFSAARKNGDVPLFEFPMRGRLDLRPVRSVVRLIRERGYNLLHAHTPRSLLIASAASVLTRVPLVYHIHSPSMADTISRVRNWINASLERMSLASANHLIAVSNSLRERYLGLGFSPERITVVSNGVPCGTALPRRTGAPLVFGMVALFRPRKGLEVLLRALADLRAGGKQLRLRAIGQFETPEYEKQIGAFVKELGVERMIDWTGFSTNIEHELAQIDCFVLPSLFGEGLPMVILEAMACGRPVIASDVEGIPEAIRHGENGLLVRPNDPASLAGAMRRVTDGSVDVQALARQAARDQRKRFSVCSMARGVAQVYDRVLDISGEERYWDYRNAPCAVTTAEMQDAAGDTFRPVPVDSFTCNPELPV